MSCIPDFAEDAVYIWGAYGVVVASLALMLLGTWGYTRAAKQELEQMQRLPASDEADA